MIFLVTRSNQIVHMREATKDVELVIAMLRDDEASHQVWLDVDSGALAGMASDTVADR
ncbi:3-hydroxyisobutyrate dehydrogenase [Cupriavidus basilensis OR16]|uniref:3-hydroxyisobutyrate dehydrogenase n=1 Tax=Cupriavidus basilensis OR16 TaxID=1127483 RepID=H1S863_9BURK|nr:3-hydroxyisobutyrate dehydrogenase [Cupriavidus basilensis OR16]